VGFLIERKSILELVQAFARARAGHPDARLRLVGAPREPQYVDRVREYARREGIQDAVTFVGVVSEDQLLDEYERAAALVLMSRQETAPGVIGEAMAAGKAVLASRICGIPYMVDDGATGLLAEPDDVADFAEKLGRLLSDPDACRDMGRRGRQKALRRFHPDRVAEETVKVYRRVLDET